MNTKKQLESVDLFKHHEEAGKEQRELILSLHKAKLKMIELQKKYQESSEDKNRFAFQDAIGLVYRLEKKLWTYR